MARINDNYLKLQAGYLFRNHPQSFCLYERESRGKVIRLGIGDVTQPLVPAVIKALHEAVDDLATSEGFHGYGPEQGYEWLAEIITEKAYKPLGVDLKPTEVFISDGSKSDCANILDIFALDNKVAIGDPVYPVYNDTNVMVGRSGKINKEGYYDGIVYMPFTKENNFNPAIPKEKVDLIYLCLPNNPTGTVMTREQLKVWVDYARENKAIILFDAAYEAYITNPEIPHSIYQIEGAKECAIEFRSFSKGAGFTGVRCAFTVIPDELVGTTSTGETFSCNKLWHRRVCTKFNGAPYPVQKAAAAVYSEEGAAQVKEVIDYYMETPASSVKVWMLPVSNMPAVSMLLTSGSRLPTALAAGNSLISC